MSAGSQAQQDDGNGRVIPNVFRYKTGSGQTVASGAASAQSAAVSADARFIRVVATVAALIEIGVNPTASATSHPIGANVAEIFPINGGDKVAAIQAIAAGNVFFSEVL